MSAKSITLLCRLLELRLCYCVLCITLDAHLHESKCISWICRPDLRIVPNTSNTIKLILLTNTALDISTEVSFTVMDQWQRGRERGKTHIICQKKKLRSSQPEGMLFWKSIFLPRVSSSNIMRRPLNKTLKTKKSGKDSHTKVIHCRNHSESLWLLQPPPPKKTPEMPVFERWAGWGTLSKTKREMQVDHEGNRWAGGKGNSNSTLFQMSFTQLHRTNILFNCVWGRLHNLNLDLMTIMWKFLSNSYHNFTTYTCRYLTLVL